MHNTVLASVLGLAGLASAACLPETFSFPSILGAEHVQTTTAVVHNHTAFHRFTHEGELLPAGGIAPFCNVTVSYTHPGHGDLVSVHVWLPLERRSWNGVFLGAGGGGFVAGDVDGDGPSAALHAGYVVAATDAGHLDGQSGAWGLAAPGNVNYPGFVNFAYRSLHELAVVGKHVLREFYAEEEKKSYFAGCSTGGRQGLAVAQRYPGDFDGVLVMCPAVEFPGMVSALYYPQLVMRETGWWPGECELGAVVGAIVEGCDASDGVVDGIIGRLDECDYEKTLENVAGKEYDCDGVKGRVDERTVDVVRAVVRGLEDEEGEVMFPGYVPGAPMAGLLGLMNAVCEDGDREKCEESPFPVTDGWIRYFIQKDPGFELKSMDIRTYRDVFRRGVEEYDSAIGSSADLRRFRERGGKVLMWHGMADQCITVTAGRRLYEQARELDAKRGVRTEEYWRYFEVPGVNHCMSLRRNAYPFDALDRLRRWVEEGVAPEELDARKIVQTEEGGKGLGEDVRTICRWPEEGVWDGKRWQCLQPGKKVGAERDEL